MLLMYGMSDPRQFDSGYNGKIFNLTTLKEGYEPLRYLIPPNSVGHGYDYEFDLYYANYIMQNDNVFAEFFKIIHCLYLNIDVYIMANKEDWSENLLESLLKLIQQRYGINAINIESDEDYIDAKLHSNICIASGYGLYNFDIDKIRFFNFIDNYVSKFGCMPFYVDGYIMED